MSVSSWERRVLQGNRMSWSSTATTGQSQVSACRILGRLASQSDRRPKISIVPRSQFQSSLIGIKYFSFVQPLIIINYPGIQKFRFRFRSKIRFRVFRAVDFMPPERESFQKAPRSFSKAFPAPSVRQANWPPKITCIFNGIGDIDSNTTSYLSTLLLFWRLSLSG
ncbi:hypothetical protein N7G274_002303 [Stereocaulon virgatum]|uniref:Uncharacterized protein n=1 Tax=Stereocaulon virgatum TaxID=373712 RepID=A0ABR4AIF5_9LECA